MFNKFIRNSRVTFVNVIKVIVAAISIAAINTPSQAQEDLETLNKKIEQQGSVLSKLSKLKISGYIQTQFQSAEYQADGTNFKLANRQNAYETEEEISFSRFGVRRGRIKFLYEDGLFQAVFQPDFSEKGVSFKDVYLAVKDPWVKSFSLKAGIFDRPFGHEISYSSSSRESPERSRIFQTLFPDERDLGAMLTLQAPSTSPINFLKLEAGLFAGNGIRPQFDNRFDFIGHLSASKKIDNVSVGGGISFYSGGQRMFNGVDDDGNPVPVYIYEVVDNQWVKGSDNQYGESATRQYFGVDFQFNIYNEGLGLTQLRAEYIMGTNPGSASGITLNPTTLLTGDRYLRDINGGYVILTQDILTTPLAVVVKYDWYNPNTNMSGNDIKGAADISMNNIGVGLIWYIHSSMRLTGYYDIVSNELSDNASGYKENRKDNVFTLRLQYKF